MPQTDTSSPVTTPDPGYQICDDCQGLRVCRMCMGKGQLGGQRCVLCAGAKICSECEGVGQIRKD